MFYHKKCFWWCSLFFIIVLVGIVAKMEYVCAAPQTITFTIGEGEDVRHASGIYDEERGMAIINTRGGLKLGPLMPPTTAKDKVDARKDLRGDKL